MLRIYSVQDNYEFGGLSSLPQGVLNQYPMGSVSWATTYTTILTTKNNVGDAIKFNSAFSKLNYNYLHLLLYLVKNVITTNQNYVVHICNIHSGCSKLFHLLNCHKTTSFQQRLDGTVFNINEDHVVVWLHKKKLTSFKSSFNCKPPYHLLSMDMTHGISVLHMPARQMLCAS